jgi:four helix bundle protein
VYGLSYQRALSSHSFCFRILLRKRIVIFPLGVRRPRFVFRRNPMVNPDSRNGVRFDFERLIVFQKALQAQKRIAGLLANPPRRSATVLDHLDRAATSVLLNIAEGSGKQPGSRDRSRFYRTALGSAKEAGACLIVLQARGIRTSPALGEAKSLLKEVVAKL